MADPQGGCGPGGVAGVEAMILHDWATLAQHVVEPVPGGAAGWVGAGMLGMVLSWLFFVHLPGKDKQLLAVIEANSVREAALRREFLESLRAQRDEFRAMLQAVGKLATERGA